METNRYYVYPDGFITDEPVDFMSDDYAIIMADDEEEARMRAVQMGLL